MGKNTLGRVSLITILTILMVIEFSWAEKVQLQVKDFGDEIFVVFYQKNREDAKISYHKDLIEISYPEEVTLDFSSDQQFNKYLYEPKIVSGNVIRLNVKNNLDFIDVINGEKLVAAHFKVKSFPTTTYIKSSEKEEQYSRIILKGQKNDRLAIFYNNSNLNIVFPNSGYQIFTNETTMQCADSNIQKDNKLLVCSNKQNLKVSKIVSVKDNIEIYLQKNFKTIPNPMIKLMDFDQDKSTNIVSFAEGKLVNYEDNITGDMMAVLMVDQNFGNPRQQDHLQFKILESTRGLAVKLINENLSVTNQHKVIKISNIPEKKYLDISTINNESILPIKPVNNFYQRKKLDTQLISCSGSEKEKYLLRLKMAQLLFSEKWYHESVAVLELLRRENDSFFREDFTSQFLHLVGLVLTNRSIQAESLFQNIFAIYDNLPPEFEMWKKYNDYILGQNISGIEVIPQLNKYLSHYPDNLYWKIVFADLELKILNRQTDKSKILLNALRSPKDRFNMNSIIFYSAMIAKESNEIDKAIELFTKILKDGEEDNINMVRAELNFVQLLYSRKLISLAEAITRLKAIKTLARGQKIEKDLLFQLVDYYKKDSNLLLQLRTLFYISKVFPDEIDRFYVTGEMTSIFNKLFAVNGFVAKADPFQAISLYYEFQDLVPIGTEGDKVILMITKKFVELDLLDEAIKILEHQIKYRLAGEYKVITASHLAVIYLFNNQPLKAIEVLEYTDDQNYIYKEYLRRLRIKAAANLLLQNYGTAIKYISEDCSLEAYNIRKEALFSSSSWQKYINLVEPSIIEAIKLYEEEKLDKKIIQDILRISIAYSMLEQKGKLKHLHRLVKPVGNKKLDSFLVFLIKANEPISMKDLDENSFFDVNQIDDVIHSLKESLFHDQ